ncbi:MAG TPA: cold shock and DUF1294 domain-containing protein [Steroidobacteraceae bacterium]|nr:cold shock and DUF1294 domain-containing protein [Steroidobacteraceae bacterium]
MTNWDDDKGFGFVTPDKGGLRAFVHIRAFSYRQRRPRNGDVISYQLTWDQKGRPRAENVLFRDAPAPRAEPAPTRLAAFSLLAAMFIAAIVALATSGRIPWFVPPAYVAMSLLTFCVYAFDKSAAMNRRWRTSEQSLHLLSLLGGWPGALIAQRMFHHKSKKVSFQVVFWLIVAMHCAAAFAFATGYADALAT